MNKKKTILILYLVVAILLSANLIADVKFETSIAGYWPDRILFWLWFFSTFYILFAFWKKMLTKIYFGILVLGVILSILPMMIPFFGIILSITGRGLYFKKQITPKYRVQIVNYGIMGRPFIELMANKGILEKRVAIVKGDVEINNKISLQAWDITDAKLVTENDSTLIINFSNDDLSGDLVVKKEL